MENLLKQNKYDRVLMCCVYGADLLMAIIFMFTIWHVHSHSRLQTFFIAYFSFFCGSKFVIDSLLIRGALSNKVSFLRMYLLLAFIIIEISIMVVNCFYYSLSVGDFWSDGYIFMIFYFVMIITCLRRYRFLRDLKKEIVTQTEGLV